MSGQSFEKTSLHLVPDGVYRVFGSGITTDSNNTKFWLLIGDKGYNPIVMSTEDVFFEGDIVIETTNKNSSRVSGNISCTVRCNELQNSFISRRVKDKQGRIIYWRKSLKYIYSKGSWDLVMVDGKNLSSIQKVK